MCIKNIMVFLIRNFLLLFLFFIVKILDLINRILIFIDPNGFECKLQEIFQNQIDKKIGSNLKFKKNINYSNKLSKKNKKLNFYTPTKISSHRAYTLFSKERETIKWIDNFGSKNNIFFDIGANMGVYSLYYAKLFKAKTYSFEPSFRNLYLLKENINLNRLNDYISIIPNCAHSMNSINFLNQNNSRVSGLAETYLGNTYSKRKKNNLFSKYKTLSFSIDFLTSTKILPFPRLIKIDVDGNELDVIDGATNTIQNKNCKSVLVEVRNDTEKKIIRLFEKYSFSLYKRENMNLIFLKND